MSSLKDNFNELIERVRRGRDLDHASFEPIYYLVFSPAEVLEVKRSLPAWTSRLRNEGWDVHCFSIAEHISEILSNVTQRNIWLMADRKAPLNWDKANHAIANALETGALKDRLLQCIQEIAPKPNAIVLVTDLEALHPYMRIGTIEADLIGKFEVPTVFLYPGERVGNTQLRFMGFYPGDGNYRSVHVGG